MKKKLAYLLAASKDLVFAAANVAISINRYSTDSDDYEILMYLSDLDDADGVALSKIPNLIVKKLSFPSGFRETMLSRQGLPNGRWDNPDSLVTFAHYEIFNLLSEYKTVIWMDIDISIQGEISSLKSYGPLGLAKDFDSNGERIWKVKDQFDSEGVKLLKNYSLNLDSDLNALIVVDDSLPNYDKLSHYCYNKTMEYAKNLVNPDQAIFQLMIQDFNFQSNIIPWEKFICHCASPNASLAHIVHFGGNRKIWDTPLLCQCFPGWVRVHHTWTSLGGRDYKNLTKSKNTTKSIYYNLASNFFIFRIFLRNLLKLPYRLIKRIIKK